MCRSWNGMPVTLFGQGAVPDGQRQADEPKDLMDYSIREREAARASAPAIPDLMSEIVQKYQGGSNAAPAQLDNLKTCPPVDARVLTGNHRFIGRNTGAFGKGVTISSGSAAIIPSEFGMTRRELTPYVGQISGTVDGKPLFSGVSDKVDNKVVPAGGLPGMTTGQVFEYLNPGSIILEVQNPPPGPDHRTALFRVPQQVNCPVPPPIKSTSVKKLFALLSVLVMLPDGAQARSWPAVQPIDRTIVVANANDPRAGLDVAINDVTGHKVYDLKCHNFYYDMIDPDDDSSGVMQCHLYKRQPAIMINLLNENLDDGPDWANRGRFLDQHLARGCAGYPEWGAVRHFHLRNMVLTLSMSDVHWAPKPDWTVQSYKFSISVKPDGNVGTSITKKVAVAEPRWFYHSVPCETSIWPLNRR
jgi:hypothetical protein